MSRLRVAHIARTDTGGFGAGHFAWELHQELPNWGVDSTMLVLEKNSSCKRVHNLIPLKSREFSLSNSTLSRLLLNSSRSVLGADLRPEIPPAADLIGSLSSLPERPDIIHIHGLETAPFPIEQLKEISLVQPTVVSLRDTLFIDGVTQRELFYPFRNRASWKNSLVARSRAKALTRANLHLVCASERLKALTCNSFLRTASQSCGFMRQGIISGNSETQREVLRQELFLPKEAVIIAFAGERFFKNAWFDFDTVTRAFKKLTELSDSHYIIAIGLGTSRETIDIGGVQIRFLPYLFDKKRLAKYLAASDIYLHAHTTGSFSTGIVEAMSASLPVVGIAMGETPSQIKHDLTGLLWPEKDHRALWHALSRLITSPELRNSLGTNAYRSTLPNYSISSSAEAYGSYYCRLTGRKFEDQAKFTISQIKSNDFARSP